MPVPADAPNTDSGLTEQRTVARELYSALGAPKRTSGMLERKGHSKLRMNPITEDLLKAVVFYRRKGEESSSLHGAKAWEE